MRLGVLLFKAFETLVLFISLTKLRNKRLPSVCLTGEIERSFQMCNKKRLLELNPPLDERKNLDLLFNDWF